MKFQWRTWRSWWELKIYIFPPRSREPNRRCVLYGIELCRVRKCD